MDKFSRRIIEKVIGKFERPRFEKHVNNLVGSVEFTNSPLNKQKISKKLIKIVSSNSK